MYCILLKEISKIAETIHDHHRIDQNMQILQHWAAKTTYQSFKQTFKLLFLLMKILQMKILVISLLLTLSSCAYNRKLAQKLAYFCGISYESQETIDNWSCSDCASYPVKSQKSFFSSAVQIQGYAAYDQHENAIIVVFRGSVNIQNWFSNLNTVITSYPNCSGCNVHLGFYQAYKGVSPLVHQEVARLRNLYKDADIFVTGHSLGGAMAVLSSLDLKSVHDIAQVYTYGQPRVGNQKFADFYESQISSIYHVINFADIVVHAPPRTFAFRHGGRQIWYSPRGMTVFKDCPSQDPNCANSKSTITYTMSDHGIEIYKSLQTVKRWDEWIRVKLIGLIEKIRSENMSQDQLDQLELIKYTQGLRELSNGEHLVQKNIRI